MARRNKPRPKPGADESAGVEFLDTLTENPAEAELPPHDARPHTHGDSKPERAEPGEATGREPLAGSPDNA